MKMIKFILVFILFIYIPNTACAALYQDQANNFQMDLPDNWITNQINTLTGNLFIINNPTVKQASIFMTVSNDVANQDLQTSLENYNQQDIANLIESMKTEISHLIPEVKFESAETRYFAKNKAIQLNYIDGSQKYCITEFFLQGNIYMLIFTAPQDEYLHLSPVFFNLLTSIKIITESKNLIQNDIPTV